VETFQPHPTTGLPVEPHHAFEVGDLVTEGIMSDGYPGVVSAATAKTVWVQRVKFVGNFNANDAPGYNGYGDSGTIAVDPEHVKAQVAKGKEGARRYFLRVYSSPVTGPSLSNRDAQRFGPAGFHRSSWRSSGGGHGHLSPGARYRQDPHV
jgi:hypothetical protein